MATAEELEIQAKRAKFGKNKSMSVCVGNVEEFERKRKSLQSRSFIGERTVEDAMTLGGGATIATAVDQLGLDILMGFRRKVFGILFLQGLVIWGVASGIARIPFLVNRNFLSFSKMKTAQTEFYIDGGIFFAVCLMLMVTIGIAAYHRYRFPHNLIGTCIFTVQIGIVVALLGGINCFYGMAMVVGCIGLVAIPSCVRFNNKVIEVFPVSVCVAILTIPIGTLGWLYIVPHIHALWVFLPIVLNMFAMSWIGYEMDWICSRLNPDEWMLPVVLVWVELVVILIITFVVVSGAAEGGTGGSGNSRCGVTAGKLCIGSCTVLYLGGKCWIYDDGSSSKRNHKMALEEKQAEEDLKDEPSAPKQEEMMEV